MKLEDVSDRLELEHLIVRYTYAIDERAWDKLDDIFAEDAYIDYRAMGGIDGKYPVIRKWLPDALKHFPAYMHFVGNFYCEISGDEAIGKIACFNPMVIPAQDGKGAETMFLGLWYLDKYRRTQAGWRIVERVEKKCYDFGMPQWMKKALGLQ